MVIDLFYGNNLTLARIKRCNFCNDEMGDLQSRYQIELPTPSAMNTMFSEVCPGHWLLWGKLSYSSGLVVKELMIKTTTPPMTPVFVPRQPSAGRMGGVSRSGSPDGGAHNKP